MSRDNSDNGFGEWGGYMDAKIAKLEEQFSKSSDPFRQSNLFDGISVYVNGLTNPSSDEIKRIMMVHGGTFHHYQRAHTTYVIASNLPDVKIRNINTSKILSPRWILDCLQQNKIVDYTKYLLYTNHKPSQPKINFENKFKIKKEILVEKKKENKEVADIIRDLTVLNEKMKTNSEDKIELDIPFNSNKSFEKNNSLERKEEVLTDAKDPLDNVPKDKSSNVSSKGTVTAVDPRFLSDFYNNSRLHHIATLGANFKQYISEMRKKNSTYFPAREALLCELTSKPYPGGVTIMHIDMDCFFVSVGLRSRPQLRGFPIAVTHSKGGTEPMVRAGVDRQQEMNLFMKRFDDKLKSNILNDKVDKIKNGFDGLDSLSEIASCSYEAREKGVKNGMFVGQALKLCPNLKTIPYEFEAYKEVAFTLYNTIAQYTLNIEAVSCDEMYVDLSEILEDLQVDVMEFLEFIRNQVKESTGCPCSAGVGENRLQARMATKRAKPDGQYYLNADSVKEYMAAIPIKDLPGVGYSTVNILEKNNWRTCGDLQKESIGKLQNVLGKKLGETLHQYCRGIDNRTLVYEQIRKSVSAEVNYGIRFSEFNELERFLKQLCSEVHSRLIEIKRKGKCITLKVMIRAKDAPIETSKFMGHGVCDHFTKSVSLSQFTCDLEIITKTVLSIMKSLNIPPKELRGLGIQISKLDMPNTELKNENVLKNMFNKVSEKQKEKKASTEVCSNQLSNTSNPSLALSKSPTKSQKKNNEKISERPRDPREPPKSTKTPDIVNMLQNISNQKRTFESDLTDIDMSVLAELPEDIRLEIMENHQKITNFYPNKMETTQKVSNYTKCPQYTSKINVDQEFLNALPPDIRKEIEAELSLHPSIACTSTNSTKSSNIVQDFNCEKPIQHTKLSKNDTTPEENIFRQPGWRLLLQDWIDSTSCPESYDVEILSKHARELIITKKAYDLYVPIKFLCRIISSKNSCSWHAAYKTFLCFIQMEMKTVYGAPMFLNVKINCDKCV